jgi:hypothetical protein
MYLDDWLINEDSLEQSEISTQKLVALCQHLGITLNREKSELIPTQRLIYLGMEIDTSLGLVFPTMKRISKFLEILESFMEDPSPPALNWFFPSGSIGLEGGSM